MSEFKPIETQEQLDAIIGERIQRAKDAAAKEYADYGDIKAQNEDLIKQIADLNAQITAKDEVLSGNTKTVEELQAKVQSYETASVKTKIALETGLPYELADKLAGSNEDEIREDAKRLASFIKPREAVAPMGSPEPRQNGDPKKSAFLELSTSIKDQE